MDFLKAPFVLLTAQLSIGLGAGCSSRALNGYLAGVDEGKAALRSERKEDEAVPGLVVRPAPSWDYNVFFSSSKKATLPRCLQIISNGLLLMRSHSKLIGPAKARMVTSLLGTLGTCSAETKNHGGTFCRKKRTWPCFSWLRLAAIHFNQSHAQPR